MKDLVYEVNMDISMQLLLMKNLPKMFISNNI